MTISICGKFRFTIIVHDIKSHTKEQLLVIIVAFLENATIEYSLESVCVGGGLHDNLKRNQSRNMKFKFDVVNENN